MDTSDRAVRWNAHLERVTAMRVVAFVNCGEDGGGERTLSPSCLFFVKITSHKCNIQPMARSKTASSAGGKRKYKRHAKRTWNVYIYRTLKQVHKGIGMSSRAMRVINSFCQDIFERIAVEAAALTRFNKSRTTMSSREIQTAVRLVLPNELARHAMAEGTKAVAKYSA